MIGRSIRGFAARGPASSQTSTQTSAQASPHASAQASSRRVWRMSREHPMGVYVDADAPLPRPARPADEAGRSWQTSSFDLLEGLQVNESPLEGLADERVDDLFKAGG